MWVNIHPILNEGDYKMGYIYKIINIKNQKAYIGQTTKQRPTDRFSQHKYLATHPEQQKSISFLHRAMNKNGINNFNFKIIECVDNSLLDQREKYWINFYNTLVPNGYNLTAGGCGTPGFSRPQTDKERQKKGASLKKYYQNHPQALENISERTKKLWEDPEYRKKVTQGNQKFYQEHPDMFKGKNNPMYGKHHTKEALEKIRTHAATRKLKIAQLDKETLEIINIYDGVKDAEKALNVSHGWISKAARQDKIAYGFKWKFL